MHARTLALSFALAMAGCASTGGKDMLSADAPRALPDAGPVSIRWNDPSTFAEIRNSHNRYEAARGDWLPQLAQYLRKRAEPRLGTGERLDLTIVDVDRAGEFEPWHSFNFHDTRIVRDIYPPRMTVQFTHVGADGRVLAQGERKLSDPGFLTGATPIDGSDPLRFEKRMIDSWLRRELQTAAR